MPPLLDAVLLDYQRNIPQAREPEVLSTLSTLITRLGPSIIPRIPEILDAVFQCTLEMINKVPFCSISFPSFYKVLHRHLLVSILFAMLCLCE